jgi:hypothetical protein
MILNLMEITSLVSVVHIDYSSIFESVWARIHPCIHYWLASRIDKLL